MSARPFILQLGTTSATLFSPQGESWPLAATAEDAARLQSLCQRESQTPILVLLDHAAIRIEPLSLPPVGWLDRQKLLARHQRLQPATRLSLIESTTTRSWQQTYLDPDTNLAFWLQQLEALPNPPAGFCFMPQLLRQMLARLQSQQEWQMLFLWQDGIGLRQIVTHREHLVLTRLSLITNPDAVATTIVHDIKATQHYLTRHGLQDPTQLQGVIIAPHSILTQLPETGLQPLSPLAVIKHLGLPPTDHPAVSFAHQQRRSLPLILTPTLRQKKHQSLMLFWLQRGRVFLWLLLLLLTGWQGTSLLTLHIRNEKITREINQIAADYQQAYEPVADLIAPLQTMREAAERQALFQSPTLSPAPLLKQIGASLPPAIRLAQITWQSPDGQPQSERLSLRAEAPENDQLLPILQQALPDYKVSQESYAELVVESVRQP